MLNRLYIVVGLLAIAAIAAAFIVPRFIEWGDYRDRMQEIASEVFGAPVEIAGEIEFSLLPQPRLRFADIVVGVKEQPAITVESVEAQFSLIDFIRDRYLITRLVLQKPAFQIAIDAEGKLAAGLQLAERVTTADISVANAQIVEGNIVLSDARTGETFAVDNIDGEVRMEALRGPFSFQGNGDYDGQTYALRLATLAVDPAGATQLSAFVRAADDGFSISAEGLVTTGEAPGFSGALTYRQVPRGGQTELEDAGKGDLVITGKVEASPARILLSDYTLIPDENRAGTRLQGTAAITLGKDPSFEAAISGGVMALPPRDATAEQMLAPYELVRLLAELPPPPMPGLPGTIRVEVAELDLRAVSLRDVRLDATADASGWTIDDFSAQLRGTTNLTLSGALSSAGGDPNFSGMLSLTTDRLDALAQLWRKPAEANPLFNLSGALEAEVSLVGDTLSLSGATLTLDGMSHAFSAEIGFASTSRHLNISASVGELDPRQSATLAALLPDLAQDASFGVTFPKGRFSLAAQAATISGLEGTELSARGSWEGGVLVIDEVAAGDLGGARFDGKLTAFGSLAKPEISGTGSVTVASADAPVLTKFYNAIAVPASVRDFLRRSLPADLAMRLDAPSGDGGQTLALSGLVGTSQLTLDAQLGQGFIRALGGPVSVRLDLRSADPQAMTAQLGLGELSLMPMGDPMHLVALIEGSMANSLETTLRVEGGRDSLAFAGNVFVSDPDELSGNGTIRATLSDLSALAALAGADGVHVPAVSGTARIEFAGTRKLQLDGMEAVSGGQPVKGQLALTRTGEISAMAGMLELGNVDGAGLFGALAGPAALIMTGESQWPDGPLAIGDAPRRTTGRVGVTTPAIILGGKPVATDASFEFDWDATTTRLRRLTGAVGDGKISMELGICCAGPLADKQVSGRLALSGVEIDAVVPTAVASALSGVLDGGARFEGTGDSLLGVLRGMTGEGSYTVKTLRVERFNPQTFAEVAALDTILQMEPAALSTLIVDRLDDGPFLADEVSGGFAIAGGVLRSANLAVEGEGVRLFGSTSLRLTDLTLDGGYIMSPTAPATPNALIDQSGAQVSAKIGGTLSAPSRSFDVAAMVDAIMVRAYEIEVARLEQLRAEDEARRQAAAAERARLAEEAAKKAAEEAAAKKAAEQAVAKAATEEAARKRAEEEAAAEKAAEEEALRRALRQTQPLDLGLGN
ncbi:MAG: AsmA family protein [Devosia sp.]